MTKAVLDVAKMKRLRADLDLSATDAARLCGWKDRRRWSAIETGRKKDISLKTLSRIAKALGVRAADLLK